MALPKKDISLPALPKKTRRQTVNLLDLNPDEVLTLKRITLRRFFEGDTLTEISDRIRVDTKTISHWLIRCGLYQENELEDGGTGYSPDIPPPAEFFKRAFMGKAINASLREQLDLLRGRMVEDAMTGEDKNYLSSILADNMPEYGPDEEARKEWIEKNNAANSPTREERADSRKDVDVRIDIKRDGSIKTTAPLNTPVEDKKNALAKARDIEEQGLLDAALEMEDPGDQYRHYVAAQGIRLLRDSLPNIRPPKDIKELKDLDDIIRRNLGLSGGAKGASAGGFGALHIDVNLLNDVSADGSTGKVGSIDFGVLAEEAVDAEIVEEAPTKKKRTPAKKKTTRKRTTKKKAAVKRKEAAVKGGKELLKRLKEDARKEESQEEA